MMWERFRHEYKKGKYKHKEWNQLTDDQKTEFLVWLDDVEYEKQR